MTAAGKQYQKISLITDMAFLKNLLQKTFGVS